jgi:hypothetical protein
MTVREIVSFILQWLKLHRKALAGFTEQTAKSTIVLCIYSKGKFLVYPMGI